MSGSKPSFPRRWDHTNQVMLRLTPEEYQDLIKRAKELGHSFPDTIRVHMGWDPRFYPRKEKDT